MYKKIILIVLMTVILTACNEPIGGDQFFDKLSSLEQAIKKEDWQKAETYIEDFNSYYKRNIWKLQLFGDEGEYEGMHESLRRLNVAIEQEDVTQALIELGTIRAFVEEIYSF